MTTAIVSSPRIIATGRIEGQSPVEWTTAPDLSDDFYLGRALYIGGIDLDACTNASQRCGHISAHSEHIRLELERMGQYLRLEVDDWRVDRSEL